MYSINKFEFTLLVIFFMVSCNSMPKNEGNKLCKDFANLNLKLDYNKFKFISIDSREINYNEELGKYVVKYSYVSFYDSLEKSYVKIPIIDEEHVDIELRCNEKCLDFLKENYSNSKFDLNKSLIAVREELINSLKIIQLPDQYNYTNILSVNGKPFHGLIEFKLLNSCTIIYVWDYPVKLPDYVGEKINDNWYHKI